MSDPIHIFIAEDHPLVHRGIVDLLHTEPDMRIMGEAGNGRD
ncbi:MAG: hypothetical protein R3293_08935 [Candidatus Promineifilaceae bacterium]|nr:hypothetical protein [Candidatus Promineifilaceae bacterium]